MSNLINLSEGVSLALRGLVIVAKEFPNRLNIKKLANELQASEAHLSKIFQQLSKASIVKSVRGPAGGFEMCSDVENISFLDIFETIEGKIKKTTCPFSKRECDAELREEGFVSIRVNWRAIYDNPLGFWLNGKTLINGSDDIPSEYMLSAVRFGHTQYIEKESFAKTLNWLKGIHRKLHPPSNELFHLKTDKLWGRKRPIRGLGRMKRIRIK